MKERKDKGVAGLTILLSLVVMLFIIGLIVMIFVIMSAELRDSDTLYTRTSAITVGQESISLTTGGTAVANAVHRDAICTFVAVYNGTTLLASGNVTEVSECTFANNSAYSTWRLNYSYTYEADDGGAGVINDTGTSLATVTDWYDIFVVIGAMVVLILLVVVIITSIRSSGMVSGGNPQNNIGTA